jgi:hypothetical protein
MRWIDLLAPFPNPYRASNLSVAFHQQLSVPLADFSSSRHHFPPSPGRVIVFIPISCDTLTSSGHVAYPSSLLFVLIQVRVVIGHVMTDLRY